MDRLDLYRELYFKEHERKNTINDSLSLPIGVITGLIAWLFYFFNEKYQPGVTKISGLTQFIFYASLVSLILSIYFLLSSFFRPKLQKKRNFITSAYNYAYIPYPNQYEAYYQRQLTKNSELGGTTFPLSDKALHNALIDDLVECTAHNITLNDKKNARVSNAKFFLAICVLTNFFLLISMITNSTPKEDKVSKVKIVDTVNVTIRNADSFKCKSLDTLKCKPNKYKNHGH